MAEVGRQVGHRHSWRAGAMVLAPACALFVAALSGIPALADPTTSSSTPAPATSTSPPGTPTSTTETPTSVTTTTTTTETSTETGAAGHMSLTLHPRQGYAATHFTGTVTGVGACANAPAHRENVRSSQTEFQWDGGSLLPDGGTDGVPTDPATDSATINFTVPSTAGPGGHEVTVACSSERVTASFTVLAPTIAVEPEQGYAGSSFDATASGFDTCTRADMAFRWDDGTRLEPTNRGADGTFTFTVPKDAPTTPHSVTASCGSTTAQPATFTVLAAPQPTLKLDPTQGTPGTPTTATVMGFDACTPADMSFQWDDRARPEPASPNLDGTFGLVVPQDASAEAHTVTASCGSTAASPAPFTVLAASKPTLTLQPGHGQVGSDVTAHGAGFACGADVQLRWDDTLLAEGLPGTFTSSFTVPPAASSLVGHSVTASCRLDSSIKDTQTFTVTSLPKPMPEQPEPKLTLQPTSGHTDDKVQATGERFSCANHSGPVNLAWDDGMTLTDVSLDQSGHFTTSILVPAKTDGGRVTLRATCSDGIVLAADFTVLSSPPPSPKHDYWWVVWLLIGVTAIAALAHVLRQHRPVKPPPPPHIHAVGRADGAPTVIAQETPEPGEVVHTLRMDTHADLGTQTVREVDDDYSNAH